MRRARKDLDMCWWSGWGSSNKCWNTLLSEDFPEAFQILYCKMKTPLSNVKFLLFREYCHNFPKCYYEYILNKALRPKFAPISHSSTACFSEYVSNMFSVCVPTHPLNQRLPPSLQVTIVFYRYWFDSSELWCQGQKNNSSADS